MEQGTSRPLTTWERVGLTLFVVGLIAVAVVFQILRSLDFEPWVPLAGIAGGAVIAPWVWFQTRPRA
jgi:hypothetical protein